MKKIVALVCIVVMLCMAAPFALAYTPGSSKLESVVHNVTVTGKMTPDKFDPNVTAYLLSTGSTVNNVYFTCTCEDPNATMYINGAQVASGTKVQVAWMNNNPQAVYIQVYGVYGDMTEYVFFLQRRPSEARTRVSAGYLNKIYVKSGTTYIDADLVNVYYKDGNESTFHNDTDYIYKYPCAANCVYYYGTIENPTRAHNATEFAFYYTQTPDQLYRFVYIEDEIVAVMPYAADYPYTGK